MKNKALYKILTSILICVITGVAVIYNFISYFEYDYIHNSSLESLSLKAVTLTDTVILSAGKSAADMPNDNINPEPGDEPIYDVTAMDLSRSPAGGEILLTNETAYKPDLIALLNSPYPITRAEPAFIKLGTKKNNDDPLVLILHTHGTEAYYPLIRSTNAKENIISI